MAKHRHKAAYSFIWNAISQFRSLSHVLILPQQLRCPPQSHLFRPDMEYRCCTSESYLSGRIRLSSSSLRDLSWLPSRGCDCGRQQTAGLEHKRCKRFRLLSSVIKVTTKSVTAALVAELQTSARITPPPRQPNSTPGRASPMPLTALPRFRYSNPGYLPPATLCLFLRGCRKEPFGTVVYYEILDCRSTELQERCCLG